MKNIQVDLQLVRHAKKYAWKFDIDQPGITVIYGPSGAGKTTLLRAIAGLEKTTGKILVRENFWQDSSEKFFIKTYERKMGFVFQGINLFPHLTAEKNLEQAVQIAKKRSQYFSWDETIQKLKLELLLSRKISALSGGEMQRVALARSFLLQPDIFLMDEPLSALDHSAKKAIFVILKEMLMAKKIPILYVTHSWAELAALADQVILMDEGHIRKIVPAIEFIQQGAQ